MAQCLLQCIVLCHLTEPSVGVIWCCMVHGCNSSLFIPFLSHLHTHTHIYMHIHTHAYAHTHTRTHTLTQFMHSHTCMCMHCLQVVSEKCSEEIQCCCLSLLHLATEHSITAYLEFQQHGGMALIQQVLRTPQAAVGELTLRVCSYGTGNLVQMKPYTILDKYLVNSLIYFYCRLCCTGAVGRS